MKYIYAIFNGENGYDGEREDANKHLIKGRRYRITDASICQSSSRVTVLGRIYNSVLFDVDFDKLCRTFPHACSYCKT